MVILCVLFLSEPTGTSSTWNSNYTSKGFSYGMNSKDPTPQPTPRTGRNNNASFNDSSLWWQKCADKGGCNSCQLMFNTIEKVLKNFVSSFFMYIILEHFIFEGGGVCLGNRNFYFWNSSTELKRKYFSVKMEKCKI